MSITQSLAHGLEILLLFEVSHPLLTVSEISKTLGYSRSKTYRLVRTLMKYNLIKENPGTPLYSLGLNALRLGLIAQKGINLAEIALPFMRELAFQTKETVLLTSVNGTKGVCLERVESGESVRSSTYHPGESLPLYCGASGKILMAYLPEEEWSRIISREGLRRYTSNTITKVSLLKEHLREIREKGYAFSDREVYQDVRAIAAPIFNVTGGLLAGLTIAGPVYRINKRRVGILARLAVECAQKITDQLGCAMRTIGNNKAERRIK